MDATSGKLTTGETTNREQEKAWLDRIRPYPRKRRPETNGKRRSNRSKGSSIKGRADRVRRVAKITEKRNDVQGQIACSMLAALRRVCWGQYLTFCGSGANVDLGMKPGVRGLPYLATGRYPS